MAKRMKTNVLDPQKKTPAPKFKVGDKVIFNGCDDDPCEIVSVDEQGYRLTDEHGIFAALEEELTLWVDPVTKGPMVTDRPGRRCAWRWLSTKARVGILEITDDRGEVSEYLVERHSRYFFTFEKVECQRRARYTVLHSDTPFCGCPGFENRKTCKHLEALMKLDETNNNL